MLLLCTVYQKQNKTKQKTNKTNKKQTNKQTKKQVTFSFVWIIGNEFHMYPLNVFVKDIGHNSIFIFGLLAQKRNKKHNKILCYW